MAWSSGVLSVCFSAGLRRVSARLAAIFSEPTLRRSISPAEYCSVISLLLWPSWRMRSSRGCRWSRSDSVRPAADRWGTFAEGVSAGAVWISLQIGDEFSSSDGIQESVFEILGLREN